MNLRMNRSWLLVPSLKAYQLQLLLLVDMLFDMEEPKAESLIDFMVQLEVAVSVMALLLVE